MPPPSGITDRFALSASRFLVALLLLTGPTSWDPPLASAHFLFANLEDGGGSVRVTFSEPVAMAGPSISYLGDRVREARAIDPSGDHETTAIALEAGDGFLSGPIPPPMAGDNSPLFVTGFLDYGDFGREGAGDPVHLQYTFSAQRSSTNPHDDWESMVCDLGDPDGYVEAEAFDADGPTPFAIALRSYGPPYKAAVWGLPDGTPVRVCLYEGNGSNRKVGCEEADVAGGRIELFSMCDEVLNPCETYFAVANATLDADGTADGKKASLWSTTSVDWNGPCAGGDGGGAAVAAIEGSSPIGGSALVGFGAGVLASLLVFLVGNVCRKHRQHRQIDGHSKVPPSEEDEGSGYTDGTGGSDLQLMEQKTSGYTDDAEGNDLESEDKII